MVNEHCDGMENAMHEKVKVVEGKGIVYPTGVCHKLSELSVTKVSTKEALS